MIKNVQVCPSFRLFDNTSGGKPEQAQLNVENYIYCSNRVCIHLRALEGNTSIRVIVVERRRCVMCEAKILSKTP